MSQSISAQVDRMYIREPMNSIFHPTDLIVLKIKPLQRYAMV